MNWKATLAAVNARGPRCFSCGSWTLRPGMLNVPKKVRFCHPCDRRTR